jgi:endonuclease-3
MKKEERYTSVLGWFEENMPVAESELRYADTFQFLLAVMLSAQCTDKRVNIVTPALFAAFPTPQSLASVSPEEVYPYIRTVSYPNSKAKHLVKMAQILMADFGGHIPSTVEELQRLPGVGRKTANLVAGVAYGVPTMPVDTHVFRVSNRIGLTVNSKTPLETERELVKFIPAHLLNKAHHWLILHGRYVCRARHPRCAGCGLHPWCCYFAGLSA